MSAEIRYNQAQSEKEGTMMREGMNRLIDDSMHQSQQVTKWREVLFRILKEFGDRPDDFVIVIGGDDANTGELHFATQMRIPLGVLRSMK